MAKQDDDSKDLAPMVEALQKLPEPPPPPTFQLHRIPCVSCHEGKTEDQYRMRHSGQVPFRDNVCKVCWEADPEKHKRRTLVICAKCSSVTGELEAGVRGPSGFVFAPGACYHVNGCPTCTPGLTTSDIIEIVVWQRSNS